jgi:hypothetical protein
MDRMLGSWDVFLIFFSHEEKTLNSLTSCPSCPSLYEFSLSPRYHRLAPLLASA